MDWWFKFRLILEDRSLTYLDFKSTPREATGDIIQAGPTIAELRQEKCEINVAPTGTKAIHCGAKEHESTLRIFLCQEPMKFLSPVVPPVIFSTSLLFTLIHRLYFSAEIRVAAPPCHLVDRFCFPGKNPRYQCPDAYMPRTGCDGLGRP